MTDEIELEDIEPADDSLSQAVVEEEPKYDSKTVSKIVKREREKAEAKAYERARKEAMMELAQQQPQAPAGAPPADAQAQQPQSLGGMPQMSSEDIKALIAQQVPQHLQEQIHNVRNEHMVNSFVSKMQAAEQKYPGLEEKLGLLDYGKPKTKMLIEMVTQLDNAGDVMHEVLENPEKMSTLFSLMEEQPRLAMNKLQSIGKSITQNQEAAATHEQTKDPLSQIKPSTNTGMSDGNMSVSDYSKYWRQNRL